MCIICIISDILLYQISLYRVSTVVTVDSPYNKLISTSEITVISKFCYMTHEG